MFVSCEYCVLSGRGLCDGLITRPEESYRLWCVVVCDLEDLKNEEAMTRVGSQRHRKKITILYYNLILWDHSRIYGPSLIERSVCGAYLYSGRSDCVRWSGCTQRLSPLRVHGDVPQLHYTSSCGCV